MPSDFRFHAKLADGGAAALIERACERFKAEWQVGKRPRIEVFLEQTSPEVRHEVLRRLLLLECELTRSSSQIPDTDGWRLRFPQFEDVVRDVRSQILETQVHRTDDTVLQPVSTSTRYSDLRRFKTGGMADLYLAHDSELRRDTVLKRLREELQTDPDYAKRLVMEAEITGRLDHPGIVPVYGIGEDLDGRPFYVMRMIRGRDLQTAIDEYHDNGGPAISSRENRQRLFDLLEHMIAAANTVAFAHDSGIIHGDLKPMNVMIGRYGETFVVDWGLARTFQRTTEFRKAGASQLVPRPGTRNKVQGFTLGYVSPEQFAGCDDFGPASDIYSLGATLYQVLTNRTALRGSEPDFADRLALGKIKPPRAINSRIPKQLQAICQKAMQASPEDRYRTAKQFAADLGNWMHDEEVEAAPDGPVGKTLRWSRNHWATAVGTTLVVLALLIAGLLVSATIGRTKQAEQRFQAALDTFEQLSDPLANLEKNRLELFTPLADQIVIFCDNFLNDEQLDASNPFLIARLLDLRASANFVSQPEKLTLLSDLKDAEQIYLRLLSATPRDADAAYRLACNHLTQGRLLVRYDDLESAEPLLQDAQERFTELIELDSPPAKPTSLSRREAESHHALGELFLNRANTNGNEADYSLSADHFSQSRELRERLVHEIEQTDRLLKETISRDLARSHGYLGDLFLRRGDLRLAEDAYAKSLDLRESLYLANPSDPEHRFQFARGLANFASIERTQRLDLEQAIERLERATQLQKELTEDFPGDPDFRVDHGWTLATLAEMYVFLSAQSNIAESRTEHLHTARLHALDACTIFLAASKSDPLVLRGMALSRALRAELLQDSDPGNARKQAKLAEKCIQELEQLAGSLNQDDYFSLALAAAVLGREGDCIEALGTAKLKGTNAAERLKAHAQFGLRSISNSPEYKQKFHQLLHAIQQKISPQPAAPVEEQ